jgi:hypothetical protein
MIIPSSKDNWIVVGPGRTGSKVIVDTIEKICRQLLIFPELKGPNHDIQKLEPGKIYHTHRQTALVLQQTQPVTKCILSTRDLVDSSISWCIQPYIGEWHLHPFVHRALISQLNENIPAFYLDPKLFIHYYETTKLFYQEIRNFDLSNVIIIDYTDFQNNIEIIAKILDYPQFPIKNRPVKNPGSPEQWISNWDEIELITKDLERDPFKFLKG